MKTKEIQARLERGYTMAIYGTRENIHEQMTKDIKELLEAINYTRCCMELNNCFKVGEIVIYNGVKMRITFVDNCQKTANMYCMCDETNWEAVSLSKLKKII